MTKLLIVVGLTFLLVSCSANPTANDNNFSVPTPTRSPRADLQVPGLVPLVEDYLIPPIMSSNPSQADLGAEVYYQICLACHGDWGQGLTDEWRATWGSDQNCFQSQCHGLNVPDNGFWIPRTIPPVLGIGSLASFSNAMELYEYIARTMPWWNPGSLTEDQAWQVTAYLLRERGELSDEITLDESTAPVILLRKPAADPAGHTQGTYFYIGVLLFVGIAIIWNSWYEVKVLKDRNKKRKLARSGNPTEQTASGDG